MADTRLNKPTIEPAALSSGVYRTVVGIGEFFRGSWARLQQAAQAYQAYRRQVNLARFNRMSRADQRAHVAHHMGRIDTRLLDDVCPLTDD